MGIREKEYVMPAIILVGQRRGAAEQAAEQLGWPYFVIHESELKRAPQAREKGRLHCAFAPHAIDEAFHAIQQQLPEARLVIPLTEKAVAFAAALQDRLEGDKSQHQEFAERLTHKRKMKIHAQRTGVPCARFITASQAIPEDWTYPCVVKTEVGSGSRGLVFAENETQLKAALTPGHLAESLIIGKEFSVESFVSNGKIAFSNITDYTEPRWENVLPAGFSADRQTRIVAFNQQVIEAFGVTSGMTHLEVFDTEQGLVFGEMARRPPGGYIMDLLAIAYDLDPWIAYLQSFASVDSAYPKQAKCHAGVRMMHPGAGYLHAVTGLESAREVVGAHHVKITRTVPGEIQDRKGVGESCGYCLATAATATAVEDALHQMAAQIHWHM